MAFLDEVAKTSSERFMLFRVTPGRSIDVSSIASNGPGPNSSVIYSIDIDSFFTEEMVEGALVPDLQNTEARGSVSLSRVAVGSFTDTFQFYYQNGKIFYTLPTQSQYRESFILLYNVYYCSGQKTIHSSNPSDSSSSEVFWQPRLFSGINVNQDSSDLIYGFLSSSISTISIDNSDYDFQKYLTEDDSFSQKSANIWIYSNGEYQQIFSGKVRQLDISKKVSFRVFDSLSLLDQPAQMGDRLSDIYFNSSSTFLGRSFNIYPKDSGKVSRFFFGSSSAFLSQDYQQLFVIDSTNKYIDFTDDSASHTAILFERSYTRFELQTEISSEMASASTDPNAEFSAGWNPFNNKWSISSENPANTTFSIEWNSGPNAANSIGSDLGFDTSSDDTGLLEYVADDESWFFNGDAPTSMTPCVCTSYSSARLDSRNRDWAVGRLPAGGLNSLNVTIVNSLAISNPPLKDLDRNTYSAICYWEVTSDTEIGDTFKVNSTYHRVVWKGDTGESFPYLGTNYNMVTLSYSGTDVSGSFSDLESITIVIEDENGDYFYPIKGRDYTVSETTLGSGNTFVSISFANGFESNINKADPVNPDFDTVYARVGGSSSNHSDALKYIFEKAGVEVDNVSFGQAKSDLDAEVQFSLPVLSDSSTALKSYREYVELITKSTLSLLYVSSQFQVSYSVLSSAGYAETSSESEYSDITIDLQYDDIIADIQFSNEHNASDWFNERTLKAFEERYSNNSEILHGVKNSLVYEHVLREISSRADAIFDVLKNRRLTYVYKFNSKGLALDINDSARIESDAVAGSLSNKLGRIVGITKNANFVTIKLSDLLGL